MALCIALGVVLIANVNMGGDGDWFWYGKLFRSGTRLYTNLDFTLQPLFVEETAWFQDIVGESWIGQKIPALFHVVALAFGMFALAVRSAWLNRQKAVILVAAFLIGIRPEWYRFDDYHVLADFMIFFSAVLLLRFPSTKNSRTRIPVVILLGMLAALTFTTRLNDGAALFLFSAINLTALTEAARIRTLALFAASFAVVVTLIVLLTGDSIVSWATVSVFQAGSLKGGNAQFAADPLRVLYTSWLYLWSGESLALLGIAVIAAAWAFLVAPASQAPTPYSRAKVALGVSIVAITAFLLRVEIVSGAIMYAFLAFWTFVAYGFAIYAAVRLGLHLAGPPAWLTWKRRELVLFLPFLMILSTSLSSGGNFYDLYMPAAALLLVLPIVEPRPFDKPRMRTALVAGAALMAVSGACYKLNDPTSWIDYKTSPVFVNRAVIDHPMYGPMIVDKTLDRFVGQTCSVVQDGSSAIELLSIPFPYANYYCGISPWHDFVQTWFDTSNRRDLTKLVGQLQTAPPKWILYQRQIGTLTYHELTFNNGEPLPQRSLDTLIMSKISDGEWRVVNRQNIGFDSDWILLRTSTGVAHGRNLLANSTGSNGETGWTVVDQLPTWSIDSRGSGVIQVSNRDGISADSSLVRSITFPTSGTISLQATIAAAGVNTFSGGTGYAVDLYDTASNYVVGSLGFSNANDPSKEESFDAVVKAGHEYQLRLHFGARDGSVSFSNLRYIDHDSRRAIEIGTRTSAAWTPLPGRPTWSAENDPHGARFVLRQAGSIAVESTFYQRLTFDRSGSVAIQCEVGATDLDLATGYGYVVDLFDTTTKTVAASIGVPAENSDPKRYAFNANVVPGDSYAFRLRFQGASGTVTFSQLKIEYGTVATSWSDDASRIVNRAVSRR